MQIFLQSHMTERQHLREFLDKEHTNMRLKIQKLEGEQRLLSWDN